MYRLLPICLALLLALAAGQPAAAVGSDAADLERMTAQFERLFQPLIGGVEAKKLVYREYDNGFRSLSYPLDQNKRQALRAPEKFRTLACGHMASEPTNPSTMTNAIISDLETQYNFWWTLVNTGEEEVVRKTSVKILGPGEFMIEASEDEVPYGPNAVHLVWFNPETPFPEPGIYIHRAWVKGAGKVIYRFFVEDAGTTTLEP